ncbi:MAG TPA: peptide ABC transporter permease [Clostridiales bacterium]|jgi:peptide/nickel transport system permease protein|nr:peptide ABC transporter permease [Clostridiales bacterium]
MQKYIAKRLFQMVIMVLGITFIVFGSLYLAPGDPAQILAGESATLTDIENLRESLGLNDPFFVQYGRYLKGLLHGDLGTSLQSRQPILDEIKIRFPNTVNLTIGSMIVAIVVGVPLGIISAIKRNSFLDYIATTTALFGVSIPNFWLGIMLILVFAVKLGWFPTGGMTHWFYTPTGLKQIILPSIALGGRIAAIFMRLSRSAMLEVMQSDYIRTARAKGVKEKAVIWIHAFKNALTPLITVFGTNFGALLGGAMISEQVFAINGLGRYMINAIYVRNYPAVQSAVLVFAVSFILVTLIVDIIYVIIDPRISYES